MDAKKVLLLIAPSKLEVKLEQAFIRADFDVMCTEDSEQAISLLRNERPHALVIDWDLINGKLKEITQYIHENCRKTVLVLLSKNKRVRERIHAMKEGADDCLFQPPNINELVTKVKTMVHRIELITHAPKILTIKDIEINLDTHQVRKAGKLIKLTYKTH